jgi:hypothetical protein
MFGDYGLTMYLLAYITHAVPPVSADSLKCPKINATRGRGTEVSPEALKSGDNIFQIVGRAQWGTSAANRTQTARIDFQATEDQDATHKGAKMVFNVIPTGSTTLTDIFEIQGDKLYSYKDMDMEIGHDYLIGGFPHMHELYLIKATPRVVTDTTTETSTEMLLICNKGTAMTVNLLAATGTRRIIVIKNIGAGTVTVDAADAETIDGETTQDLEQWESLTLIDYALGTWVIV